MTDKLLAEWFWIDRWMGSSAFLLPMESRGLYREMLTQSWRRGGSLPNDHEAIRRAIGCTPQEWRRSWPQVERYWKVEGDLLVNVTQLEVYAEKLNRHSTRSKAGSKGGSKAQANRQANVQAKVNHSVSVSGRLENGQTDRPALPANPLIAGRRPQLEADGYRIIREHAELEPGLEPTDILLEAAGWKDREGNVRSKVRLETMSDDHLIRTVRDLKANLEAARAAKTAKGQHATLKQA